MDALVTTEWLAANLDAADLRVVDASWFLPKENRDPHAEFDAAHIPGAVFFDLAALADTDTDLPNMLPSATTFASAMAAIGVGDGMRIVLYDASPHRTATRAWWMLRMAGAPEVAVLDGGFAKWRAEGRPLESGIETPRSTPFTPRAPRASMRDKAQMLANVASAAEQVIDARSAPRFAGEEPEPRPGMAAGHIPGSRNLPYARLFDADGTWKRGAELQAAFDAAGVDLTKPFVTTCGSGISACILLFGAHLLGHDGALYDGSWSDWGGDPSTPKATGTA